MDRDELIARLRKLMDERGRHACGSDARANASGALAWETVKALPDILAALESRPAPTEERAREVLASIVEADDKAGGARPTSPLGKTTAYYIRDGQGATITAWQAIRAMLRFATDTTPSPVDREAIARIVKGARLSAAFGREFRAGDGRLDDVDLDAADAILALKTSTPETQTVEGGEVDQVGVPVDQVTPWPAATEDDKRRARELVDLSFLPMTDEAYAVVARAIAVGRALSASPIEGVEE